MKQHPQSILGGTAALAGGADPRGEIFAIDGVVHSERGLKKVGRKGPGVSLVQSEAGGVDEEVGLGQGWREAGWFPGDRANGESSRGDGLQLESQFFSSLGVTIEQSQRTATASGQMARKSLTDSATAEDEDAEICRLDMPSLVDRGLPSGGVGAEPVELAALDADGVDRLGLRRGRIPPRDQPEHLIFVRQSAVPSLHAGFE